MVAELARLALRGGGSILLEAPAGAGGPVKAGRMAEAIHDLPGSLQTALGPVTDAARELLEQLRKASPGGVEVEFGVDLSIQAGAVITKGGAGCHLKVKLTWTNGESDRDPS